MRESRDLPTASDPRLDDGRPQGAEFRAVAQPGRKTPLVIVVAASAVLAIALLAKLSAPAPGVPAAVVVPARSPALSPAAPLVSPAGPAAAHSPARSSGAPSRNPTVTPHPTYAAVAVPAGTTQLIPAGPTPLRLKLALPKGWEKASDAMYIKAHGEAPAGVSISAWRLQHVNVFPCRWSDLAFADPPLMRTAEGQAEALSAWWGQDPGMLPYWNSAIAPLASKRQATTVEGYSAWYVEVLIPQGFDFTQCDGEQVVLWDTASGEVRYSLGPGELQRLWVVDVDGELIVIDAASFHATASADLAELQRVIDSIVIEP